MPAFRLYEVVLICDAAGRPAVAGATTTRQSDGARAIRVVHPEPLTRDGDVAFHYLSNGSCASGD